MQNSLSMTDNFESEKNLKASGYTAVVVTLLLLLFLYVSWTQPVEAPPVVEEGIEVNLGNSDQGLGTNQPYLPGQPSAEDKEKYTEDRSFNPYYGPCGPDHLPVEESRTQKETDPGRECGL